MDILEFNKEFRLLSNMAHASVLWGDELSPERVYPCSEVPYFLARLSSVDSRTQILAKAKSTSEYMSKQGHSRDDCVEGAAKSVKSFWKKSGLVPKNEDADRKVKIMTSLVFDKIGRNENVAKIISNSTGIIQEGVRWPDTFWGVTLIDMPKYNIKAGTGQNKLGNIYVEGRTILKEHGPEELLKRAADLRKELFIVPKPAQASLEFI